MSQSKNRPCPVAGKTITSRDCAENRGPEFGCPGDCPFNPWGHDAYPKPFLDMEAVLKDWAFSKLPESLVRSLPGLYADPGSAESLLFFHALTHAVHVGDGSRPSPLGQWLRDYPRELRKDERILAGWRDQAMPMLLEVRQVLDEAGMECVDLLEPDRPPFILRDVGMTARICRFQLLFGWAYHTPWFSRALGLLSPMAWRTGYSPEECLSSLARARGWDPAASALRDWLRLHVAEISESLHAWHELNNRAMLEHQDIVQVCITYQLKEKPEALLSRLESGMEVLEGDLEPRHRADGFTHVVNLIGAFDEDIGGKIVLGLLLLGKNKAQFEGFVCPEFDDAVTTMEKLSRGALLRLKRTELDLGAQMLAKQKDFPAREFVPDHLVEKGGGLRMNTYVFPAEEGLPDDKILSSMDAVSIRRKCTALGGLTPLEASARPDMRDKLVRHVKSLIHGIDKRRGEDGRPEPAGIRETLRDLGLQELDFPAPPMDAELDDLLPVDDDPYGEDPDSEDYEDYDDELLKIRGLADAGLPPVPPRLMLDRATVSQRVEDTTRRFANPSDAVDTVPKHWKDMFERVACLLLASEADETSPAFALLLIHFALMAHIMFPRQKKPVACDPDRLAKIMMAYSVEMHEGLRQSTVADVEDVLLDLAARSPQLEVAACILSKCMATARTVGEELGQPEDLEDRMPIIAISLLAALWEMNYIGGQ